MDKHPTVSCGNPVAVLFAVLTVAGIKYGYVSSPDWHILAYISAPMFFISLIIFRKKPAQTNTKPVRLHARKRGHKVNNRLLF
jgi:hypothetical protein